MNGRHRIIDEVNYNVLGTFDSLEEAVDTVASLLSVNDDDFLDELTISNDDGPLLHGDSLRDALRNRDAARERVETRGRSSRGGSYGSGIPDAETGRWPQRVRSSAQGTVEPAG